MAQLANTRQTGIPLQKVYLLLNKTISSLLMLYSERLLGLLSVSSAPLSICEAGRWQQGLFCWHREDLVSGMFSADCLDLGSLVRCWGLVVSCRHHTVPLNFTQPLKFHFLGRKLKCCAVLACWWSSITGACEGSGVKGKEDTLFRSEGSWAWVHS